MLETYTFIDQLMHAKGGGYMSDTLTVFNICQFSIQLIDLLQCQYNELN
jgi:hypothetical protein